MPDFVRAHPETSARPWLAGVVSTSRGIGVVSATRRSQRRSVRSTSAAGMIRWMSRDEAASDDRGDDRQHAEDREPPHVPDEAEGAVAAPTTPITGPAMLFLGSSMS